ncbi:SGNH/GDSL hydrolase family protein [Yinghuangia sp. YIM S09857]|uniref:SGNH/GDSL hydrolase family protein n=1 Tax=Yinghuangia sp. YIM S09857 TaxID=3436929 RepID=UPI003F53BAD8
MGEYRHLAAVGSSFAAGPGISPVVDRAAGRSGRNYAHLLAARFGARLTDLTVSGATTATILDTPQRTVWGRTFPPQADGVPADADLITVTAGGNDLGYAGGLMRVAWGGWLRSRPLTRPLGRLAKSAPPRVDTADVQRAADGLTRVVDALRGRAPQARIVLVDYLTVLGEHTSAGADAPFTPDEISAFRDIANHLTAAFAEAAECSGADLVRASELSAGHALGSAEPWVTGFRPSMRPAPFHPNARGMRALAEAIHRTVTA